MKGHAKLVGIAGVCLGLTIPSIANGTTVTATMSGPLFLNEGQFGFFSYQHIIDPSSIADHTHNGVVNFSFGDGLFLNNIGADGLVHTTDSIHAFVDNGTYTVSASGSTDLYDSGENYYGTVNLPSRSTTVTVLNVAPTVSSITSDSVVSLGETLDFGVAFDDPGLDTHFFEWDLDGDGAYDDYFAQNGSLVWSMLGITTVGVRITDDDGGIGVGSFQVTGISAVPAPAAFPLFAGGLGLLGLLGWRRKRVATA